MNRTILLLTISDITVLTGFGLIDPVLAIFIERNISGGSVFTAGVASSIFLVSKSLAQLPFSLHIDSSSEVQRRWWLIIGTAAVSIVPFLYIAATSITMIFAAQLLHGIGSGLAYSAWLGIWSTHLDKGRESFEWSLYSTLVGIGTAVAAFAGAGVAERYGFPTTMVCAGIFSLIGCGIFFILLPKQKLFK